MPFPITHLYVSSKAIKELGVNVNMNSYLWGSVAVDTNRASFFDNIERNHTHIGYDHSAYSKIMKYANGKAEKSFAIGYISHLVADNYWAKNVKNDYGVDKNLLRVGLDQYIYSNYNVTKYVGLSAPYFMTKGDEVVLQILKSQGISSREAMGAIQLFKNEAMAYTGFFPGIRAWISKLIKLGYLVEESKLKKLANKHLEQMKSEVKSTIWQYANEL